MLKSSKKQGYVEIDVEKKKKTPVLKLVTAFVLGLSIAVVGNFYISSRATKLSESIDNSPSKESSISYRPCEVYASGKVTSNVKIIQTSLGEPSSHWNEIPCFTVKNKRLSEESVNGFDYKAPSAHINVDLSDDPFPNRPPILGFGGAFTEAAALNYNSLNDSGKKATMELLFGKSGLGYTVGRVHMNSCDFCIGSYNFDTEDQDFQLESFDMSVQHDVTSGMIDMMLEANKYALDGWPQEKKDDLEPAVRILASPWSPPEWMKAPTWNDPSNVTYSQSMVGSAQPSCLRDGTGPDSKYAESWALYFNKFITAYKEQGIDIWAVTVQNEPEFPAPWEACSYTPEVESDFVEYHLGPMLKESHPDVKLFVFDHNKDHAPLWAETILSNSESKPSKASSFVDGVAVHWYAGGMDRLLDGGVGSANMHRLFSSVEKIDDMTNSLEESKDKKTMVLGSEACHCPSTGYAGGDLTVAWARAERYAHTVLADLASGSNGWIEWNLILDAIGGPNHLGNMCDAPLLAVPHRAIGAAEDGVPTKMSWEVKKNPFGPVIGDGRTREELHALGIPAEFLDVGVVVQPMYYYMGHISRHVRPGSKAVKALVDSVLSRDDGLDSPERTFRAKGQKVAGGGINDLARDGIELTMWPCEGSTRQEWTLSEEKQLQVFGHDWLGNPTSSCVSSQIDSSFQGLFLTNCDEEYGDPGYFQVESTEDSDDFVKLTLLGKNLPTDENCVYVKPLGNDGGAYGERGGAQVGVGDCSQSAAKWKFSSSTGEITSTYFEGGEVCLTTGWPFLQVGAFQTPTSDDGSKTVVILNEAGESANYVLKDGDKILATASIPSHSMQTLLFD